MAEVNGPQKPEKRKETSLMGQPSRKRKQASPQALEGTKVRQGRIKGHKSLERKKERKKQDLTGQPSKKW